jgi:hypothetical protein
MKFNLATLVLLACLVFVIACDSDRPYVLTRTTAQHAIEKWPQLESKTWAQFSTGRQRNFAETGATFLLMETRVPGTSNAVFLDDDRMNDKAQCNATPEELGNERKKAYLFLGCFHVWPSPEGQALFDDLEKKNLLHKFPNNSRPASAVKGLQYLARIGDPTVHVTGIVTDGIHATVDFELGFTNLNALGKAMFPVNSVDQLKYSQKAEFTKYDDGWRITKMADQLWGYGLE